MRARDGRRLPRGRQASPSSLPPSTLEFAALTKEAGLPDGVFNVVTGFGPDAGAPLVEHPDVATVSFTGSDATGARCTRRRPRSMKRVSLEFGGKSPNIVFDDADLDPAATGVVSGIFGGSGQMCIGGSRLLVQKSIKEDFTEKLMALAHHAKGDPMHPERTSGRSRRRRNIRRCSTTWMLQGRRRPMHSRRQACDGPVSSVDSSSSQRYSPTSEPEMRIAQEEVFGPILSIIEFEDEEEAVGLGNDGLRARRRGLDEKHRPGGAHVQGTARRHRMGQHVSPSATRCHSAA